MLDTALFGRRGVVGVGCLLAVALVVGFGVVGGSALAQGGAGGGGVDATPTVEFVKAGSDPAVRRYSFEVGKTSEMEITSEMTMSGSQMGQAMPESKTPRIIQRMRLEVVSVDGSGNYKLKGEVVSVDVERREGVDAFMVDAMRGQMQAMVGLEVEYVMTPRGVVRDAKIVNKERLGGGMAQMEEQILSGMQAGSVVLPERAVGTGGEWLTRTSTTMGGVTASQETRVVVESAAGERLRLRVETKITAAPQKIESEQIPAGSEMMLVDLDGRSTGTIELALDDPVAVATTTSTTNTKMEVRMMGQAMPMEQRLEMKMSVKPVSSTTPVTR